MKKLANEPSMDVGFYKPGMASPVMLTYYWIQ